MDTIIILALVVGIPFVLVRWARSRRGETVDESLYGSGFHMPLLFGWMMFGQGHDNSGDASGAAGVHGVPDVGGDHGSSFGDLGGDGGGFGGS